MDLRFRWTYFCFAGLAAALLNGCGSQGPELASVSGVVTVDARPLPAAVVEFQPASGSPSTGITDSSGKYKLTYTAKRAGAMLGKHQVRIALSTESLNVSGNTIYPPQPLPAKYNRNSELTAEVKAGSNNIDFPLKSN